MGRVLLNAENITKTYSNRRGDNTVLDGLSLQIEEGKFYAIEGESGSGKSTLLSILSGLQKPNDGVVEYTPMTRTHLLLVRWMMMNSPGLGDMI